jgi:hypothetical protein
MQYILKLNWIWSQIANSWGALLAREYSSATVPKTYLCTPLLYSNINHKWCSRILFAKAINFSLNLRFITKDHKLSKFYKSVLRITNQWISPSSLAYPKPRLTWYLPLHMWWLHKCLKHPYHSLAIKFRCLILIFANPYYLIVLKKEGAITLKSNKSSVLHHARL